MTISRPAGYVGYDEISAHLGVSPQTVRRLVQDRIIPAVKLGRKLVLFRLDDVEAALRRHSTMPSVVTPESMSA